MIKTFLISILMLNLATSAALASGGGSGETEHFKPLYPPKVADTQKAFRLEKPVLVEPKALSTVTGTATKLTWNEVKGADSYHVQVATDPNFKWLVSDQHAVKATSFDVSGLTAGQNYFWRVYGVKSDNDAQWTTGFPAWSSFSVK